MNSIYDLIGLLPLGAAIVLALIAKRRNRNKGGEGGEAGGQVTTNVKTDRWRADRKRPEAARAITLI